MLHHTREICWFVLTIHEKSAGFYLQYTRHEFTLLAVSGHFSVRRTVEYPCGLKHTPRYTRNLLVCIHDTREICWFVSTIHEKSAGLYPRYTRNLLVCIGDTRELNLLVCVYNTREMNLHYWLSVSIFSVWRGAVDPCGLKCTREICWFVSTIH